MSLPFYRNPLFYAALRNQQVRRIQAPGSLSAYFLEDQLADFSKCDVSVLENGLLHGPAFLENQELALTENYWYGLKHGKHFLHQKADQATRTGWYTYGRRDGVFTTTWPQRWKHEQLGILERVWPDGIMVEEYKNGLLSGEYRREVETDTFVIKISARLQTALVLPDKLPERYREHKFAIGEVEDAALLPSLKIDELVGDRRLCEVKDWDSSVEHKENGSVATLTVKCEENQFYHTTYEENGKLLEERCFNAPLFVSPAEPYFLVESSDPIGFEVRDDAVFFHDHMFEQPRKLAMFVLKQKE